MEYYYSIDMNRNGNWDVVMFMSKVLENIESVDLAQNIADRLNEAYKEGQQLAENRIKEKIVNFVLSK